MINFKHLIQEAGQEKTNTPVHLGDSPVWDFKAGPTNTIFLIPQSKDNRDPNDVVSLEELRKYVLSMRIPYDEVVFLCEYTKKQFTKTSWESYGLSLNF